MYKVQNIEDKELYGFQATPLLNENFFLPNVFAGGLRGGVCWTWWFVGCGFVSFAGCVASVTVVVWVGASTGGCVGASAAKSLCGCVCSWVPDSFGAFVPGSGAWGQLFLLWPSYLHIAHLFRVPPGLTRVSSFLNSQESSLRFFIGLLGKILFAGGMTSMFVFISHTFGPLTRYMIGVYVSSYVDLLNQCGITWSTFRLKNLMAEMEWQHGSPLIVHFLQVQSCWSRFTTNLSPSMDMCLTSNNFSPAQLSKQHI